MPVSVSKRKDRLTIRVPQIQKIVKTFNERIIEAIVIGSYTKFKKNFSFGDVIYLDRGRSDGVTLGNVFNVYSSIDPGTTNKISMNPVYKTE